MAGDTLGHLLALHVTPADVGDRQAVARLAAEIQDATGETVTLAYLDAGPSAVLHALTCNGKKLAVIGSRRNRLHPDAMRSILMIDHVALTSDLAEQIGLRIGRYGDLATILTLASGRRPFRHAAHWLAWMAERLFLGVYYCWLRGPATPDLGEMEAKTRTAPLPERRRWYRKNRWLRGHATPDSYDWLNGPFPA